MKIEVVEGYKTATTGRIEELEDVEDVSSCFICDEKPNPKLAVPNRPELNFCCNDHKNLLQVTDDDDEDDSDDEEFYPIYVQQKPYVGRYMVAARDIQPGEIIYKEEPLAMGPDHTTLPCCLDCMKEVDGSYLCPKCNMPACEEMCAYGEEHSKECEILSKVDPKLEVTDFSSPDTKYWCITVLRILQLKRSDPNKYNMVKRMMDHNDQHQKKQGNWNLYKEHVTDFLRDRCQMAEVFSEDEIFHVLGSLDVNSVRIHAQSTSSKGDEVKTMSGHALYPITALMSHSCLANRKVFDFKSTTSISSS